VRGEISARRRILSTSIEKEKFSRGISGGGLN
jgi:hypothetical protein